MLRRTLLALASAALCACTTVAAHPTVSSSPDQSHVLDAQANYPEGPLWQGGKLYVAEMGADRVSVFENGQKHTFFQRPECGPTALAPYGDGFLILCHIEGAVVAVDARGTVRFTRDRDEEGNQFRDPNDCFADGRGGVYFSDPGLFSKGTPPQGALVHIDAQGRVRRLAVNLWYPNGVYVDVAARELYLSETFRHRVLRYPLNEDGSLGAMSVFASIDAMPPQQRYDVPYREAGPDGIEHAPDGSIYVAIYGEGRILRLSREGAYEGQIDAPARYVTNIAFGPDGSAATTGAFENEDPSYPGEVRLYPAAALPGAR
jgi:gluconolactonase